MPNPPRVEKEATGCDSSAKRGCSGNVPIVIYVPAVSAILTAGLASIVHDFRERYKTGVALPGETQLHQDSRLDMELSLPLAVASSSILYILWKMFHPYFVTYTMDNLPGPSADSWWLGTFFLTSVTNEDHSVDEGSPSQETFRHSSTARAGRYGRNTRTDMVRSS